MASSIESEKSKKRKKVSAKSFDTESHCSPSFEDENSNDNSDFVVTKRWPPRLPKARNDIYVTKNTPFQAQFNKCKKLLNAEREIVIHGLGAAVNMAANLALQLKSFYSGSLILEASTSSVELIDDYTPRSSASNVHYRTESRKNSALHIKLSFIVEQK